ncbi:MATE family efflux transporter [Campylobacter jejuni]|uniref:MATE family efflux transporter n=1 Tax=Campylobacter jejuni TaxID=197 RepID=UPI001BA60A3F|nr:MATE family efflux transporter [Campylobacter jejuni]QUJ28423.1 MATE family efflux transporter [Campylobacter jejuni]
MAKEIDLKNEKINRLFFYYFFPSLLSMLSLSTHVIVDGFFVAHALGKDAVSALGITWPIFSAIIACELLFSVGGSAMISYYLGKGEKERAREFFSSIVYFVGLLGIIGGIFLCFYAKEISLFLGANDNLLELVSEYLSIIFAGLIVMFLHPVLDMFAVNDRAPKLAMISMVIASVGNVVFNYIFLFILNLGIYASALSTILGNIVAISILLWHFLSKRGDLYFIPTFSFKKIFQSAKNGIPACASELSASVVMLLYNLTLMKIVGERGVLIYTIVMYGGIVFFTILLSVAQGVQPIASFNYGAGEMQRVRGIYRFALVFSLFVSILLYVLFFIFGEEFVRAFLSAEDISRDANLVGDITFAMKIWFVGYLAIGLHMVSSIFLQSVQRPLGALVITLCYTIGFTILLLPFLSKHYGMIGAWVTNPLSAFLTLFVLFGVLIYERKKEVFAK